MDSTLTPSSRYGSFRVRDGIDLVPDLPDLRDEIARHAAVVLPFVSGGGIKNKLLEAASMAGESDQSGDLCVSAAVCTPKTQIILFLPPSGYRAVGGKSSTGMERCKRSDERIGLRRSRLGSPLAHAGSSRPDGRDRTGRNPQTEGQLVKQIVFMILMTLTGTIGVWVVEPFWGVAVYYLFAVLRPQFMWEWALPEGINWSRFVALSVLAALLAQWFGLANFTFLFNRREDQPPRLGTQHRCVLAFAFWIVLSYVFGPVYNPTMTDRVMEEYVKIFTIFFAASCITGSRFNQIWFLAYVVTTITLIYISLRNELPLFREWLLVHLLSVASVVWIIMGLD